MNTKNIPSNEFYFYVERSLRDISGTAVSTSAQLPHRTPGQCSAAGSLDTAVAALYIELSKNQ